MHFICSIDTEADNQWLSPAPVSTVNIDYIPRFQKLCDEFGIKVVYLVSYEIAILPQFQTMMRTYLEAGSAEVGAHLHPWSCPPMEPITDNDLLHHPYPHDLSPELFRKKMTALTDQLEKAVGERPVSYRAGRWGFCADHITILRDLGYRVDTSITPMMSWRRFPGAPFGQGGQDYRLAPNHPYFLSDGDILRAGDSGLFEIPPTVVCRNQTAGQVFIKSNNRFIKSVLSRLGLKPLWMYPTIMSQDLDRISDYLITIYKIAKGQGAPYVHMVTHSSELMPGGSPFWPTEESIDKFYDEMRLFFEFVRNDGCKGVTLKEFYSLNQELVS